MVMDTVQIRLSKGILDKIDELVEQGLYANRSDFIREAVRSRVLKLDDKKVNSVKSEGDSKDIHHIYHM